MVKAIDTAAFRAAMEEKKTLVVDFWAEWCGPCRMLAPVMEQLSDELAGKAEFVKIDVDDNPDLAREYSIMSIPCVMVFKGGALAGKNVGFVPKSAMKDFIESAFALRPPLVGSGSAKRAYVHRCAVQYVVHAQRGFGCRGVIRNNKGCGYFPHPFRSLLCPVVYFLIQAQFCVSFYIGMYCQSAVQ